MAKLIKWSQWSKVTGMIRCGQAEYAELNQWMKELSKDAHKCLYSQDKPHALFGREILDENDDVTEVRFYCDCYMSDEELKQLVLNHPHDFLWVAHKRG